MPIIASYRVSTVNADGGVLSMGIQCSFKIAFIFCLKEIHTFELDRHRFEGRYMTQHQGHCKYPHYSQLLLQWEVCSGPSFQSPFQRIRRLNRLQHKSHACRGNCLGNTVQRRLQIRDRPNKK